MIIVLGLWKYHKAAWSLRGWLRATTDSSALKAQPTLLQTPECRLFELWRPFEFS